MVGDARDVRVILANPGERMSALSYERVEQERPCIVYSCLSQ